MSAKTITIRLNDEEQETVKRIARLRIEHNRKVGAVVDTSQNGKGMTKDQGDREVNSYGGEFAYCKHFGIAPDLATDCYPKYDAVHPDGGTVDVKTTKWSSGHLALKNFTKEREYPDYFALMTGEFPTYIYRGEILASELRKPSRLTSLDGRLSPPMYVASQNELFTREQGETRR